MNLLLDAGVGPVQKGRATLDERLDQARLLRGLEDRQPGQPKVGAPKEKVVQAEHGFVLEAEVEFGEVRGRVEASIAPEFLIEAMTESLEAACLEEHRGALAYERDQMADMIREEREFLRPVRAAE